MLVLRCVQGVGPTVCRWPWALGEPCKARQGCACERPTCGHTWPYSSPCACAALSWHLLLPCSHVSADAEVLPYIFLHTPSKAPSPVVLHLPDEPPGLIWLLCPVMCCACWEGFLTTLPCSLQTKTVGLNPRRTLRP